MREVARRGGQFGGEGPAVHGQISELVAKTPPTVTVLASVDTNLPESTQRGAVRSIADCACPYRQEDEAGRAPGLLDAPHIEGRSRHLHA